MTQPNKMYMVRIVDEGEYLFSGTSLDSMYKAVGSYPFSTVEIIEPSKRFNIRELFPAVGHNELFKKFYRELRFARFSLPQLEAIVDSSRSANLCPECGYIYVTNSDSSNICNRCCAISVKYNTKNLTNVINQLKRYSEGCMLRRPRLYDNWHRISDILKFVGEGKLVVYYHNGQIYFAVNRTHFDRPAGHRFRRYANVVKWDDIFRNDSDGQDYTLDVGFVYLTRILVLSDERWEVARKFIDEHGLGLNGDEFYCAGDDEVIATRRREYIAEYISSGRGRRAIIDKIFTNDDDELIEEVSAELMRRLPMDIGRVDGIVSEDGSVQVETLFDTLNPAYVNEQIYKICCGNVQCLTTVLNNLTEEFCIA